MDLKRSLKDAAAGVVTRLATRENSNFPSGGRSGVRRFNYLGVELELPSHLMTPSIARAFDEKYYEAAEAAEVPYIMQNGERVLEIGSAIGFLSTLVAKSGKSSRVIAVEANPELVELSKRTYAINNVDVEVYNEILAAEDGEGDLYIHADFWSSSIRPWDGGRRVAVPKRSFQKRLAEWRPTLILVDIEGGEESLFDGIDLAGVERIMLEVHQENIGRAGMKHVFDVISAQNFHYDQWHSSRRIVTFTSVSRA